jgi:hypothetical protein
MIMLNNHQYHQVEEVAMVVVVDGVGVGVVVVVDVDVDEVLHKVMEELEEQLNQQM